MTAMPLHHGTIWMRLMHWLTPDWMRNHRHVRTNTASTIAQSQQTVSDSRELRAESKEYRAQVAQKIIGLDLDIQRRADRTSDDC